MTFEEAVERAFWDIVVHGGPMVALVVIFLVFIFGLMGGVLYLDKMNRPRLELTFAGAWIFGWAVLIRAGNLLGWLEWIP